MYTVTLILVIIQVSVLMNHLTCNSVLFVTSLWYYLLNVMCEIMIYFELQNPCVAKTESCIHTSFTLLFLYY